MPLRNPVTSLGGLPIQIDYTARDYEAIRAEMLKVADVLTPEWTDREPGDIGITMIEAMAYVSDILSYQLDRVQNESYLATAQTRESVVDLLRLIGYELSPASPATVGMVIRTNQDNVTLPLGFTVSTEATNQLGALSYSLAEEVQLGVAGLYCVSYEQSKVTRVFGEPSATDDRLVFIAGREVADGVGVSNGRPDQVFVLPSSPVCLGPNGAESIQLTVGGDLYEARSSFIGTEPSDKVFVYRFLDTQEVLVKFGDGVNGAIPPVNSTILGFYRVDGGEETNRAGVGSITKFDSVQGVVSVYNVNQPSGGSDPEDLVTAKKRGPLSLRALDRCVTLEDFETMALQTPGVGVKTARAVKGDSPIEVEVYVAVQGSNPIPDGKWFDSLQNGFGTVGAIGRWLNQKKPVPTRLSILRPTAVNPFMEATVYVYPNLLRQTVEFDVDVALQVLFNRITDEFGETIPLSALIQSIENTRGVDYVNVSAFHRLPQMRLISGDEDAFDSASLIISNLNAQMTREVYTVEWLNENTYQLRRGDGNLVTTVNGNEATYEANTSYQVSNFNDNPSNNEPSQEDQFTFSITTGLTLPSNGNTWEFSVDNYLSNIETRPHEIIVAPVQSDGRLNRDQFRITYQGGI